MVEQVRVLTLRKKLKAFGFIGCRKHTLSHRHGDYGVLLAMKNKNRRVHFGHIPPQRH